MIQPPPPPFLRGDIIGGKVPSHSLRRWRYCEKAEYSIHSLAENLISVAILDEFPKETKLTR